jgi:hypothetical protein
MHGGHVIAKTSVVEHSSAWRATVLPRRHVLFQNMPFCVALSVDGLAAKDADKAGRAQLQLRAHERLQRLAFRGRII